MKKLAYLAITAVITLNCFTSLSEPLVTAPTVTIPQAGLPPQSINGQSAVYPVYAMPPATPQSPIPVAPLLKNKKISPKHAGIAAALNSALPFFIPIGGIGRVYTKDKGIAAGQIILSFLLPGVGQIWSIIDGILMLTGSSKDGKGRKLTYHPEMRYEPTFYQTMAIPQPIH